MTINPTRRSRPRGRPHVNNGALRCTRCARMSTQQRTPSWPGEQLCNSCFYTAMRTYGICPICGHDGVLPGRANHTDPRPVCLACEASPRTTNAEPATPKARYTGTGDALAALCART